MQRWSNERKLVVAAAAMKSEPHFEILQQVSAHQLHQLGEPVLAVILEAVQHYH